MKVKSSPFEKLFSQIGFEGAEVEASYFRKSLDASDLPWIVFVSLGSIAAKEFVALLVKDGYDSAKRWLQKVGEGRRRGPGQVVVKNDLLIVLDACA